MAAKTFKSPLGDIAAIETAVTGPLYSSSVTAPALLVSMVDSSGNLAGTGSYQLATNQSLTSGANTTPVTGVVGGSYIWNVIGTFAGGSTVALQALASDGATWVTIGSAVTASGNVGVVIGNNASLRLLGGVATTTNLYSSLS